MRDQISELTTNRLSLYSRFLSELDEKGVKTVSSKVLAEQFGLNASLIRKDLAHVGDLGVRGVGYVVKDLRQQLRTILGLDRKLRIAIVGAGNLGLALAGYPGFGQEGFRIVGCSTPSVTRLADSRGVASRSTTSASFAASPGGRASRSRSSPSRAVGAAGGQHGGPGGDQGGPQLLTGRAPGAATGQTQERRPDRVARKPLVLSGAPGQCERIVGIGGRSGGRARLSHGGGIMAVGDQVPSLTTDSSGLLRVDAKRRLCHGAERFHHGRG